MIYYLSYQTNNNIIIIYLPTMNFLPYLLLNRFFHFDQNLLNLSNRVFYFYLNFFI